MRELKFRAWLDEYKQYIYFGGDYKEPTGRWGKGRCALVGNNHVAELYSNEDNSNMFYQVHKVECIEQYTGLKDKNGKEIYEGDIVDYNDDGDCIGCVVYNAPSYEIMEKNWNHCWLKDSPHQRVIGNIHENPELLGGTNVTNKEEEDDGK